MMTPEHLGISEKEHAAFVRVATMLEQGEIAFYDVEDDSALISDSDRLFNMVLDGDTGCGTVGCVGFWVGHFLDEQFTWMYRKPLPRGQDRLFFPDGLRFGAWKQITPAQAARAIRNYLEVGEPRWAEVVPELARE